MAADCLDGKQICLLFFWPVGQGDVAAAVGQINQLYTALKQSPQANEIEVVFVDSSEGGNQAAFDQVRCSRPGSRLHNDSLSLPWPVKKTL